MKVSQNQIFLDRRDPRMIKKVIFIQMYTDYKILWSIQFLDCILNKLGVHYN